MTGEQLRDGLARIADGAPEVHPDANLFARGRRATARARVLGAAAVVACLGLVAALVGPWLTQDRTQVADDGDVTIGVPDTIYGPPLHDQALELPVTPLDEVGPAAVAYQVDDIEGHVVLISPEGDYRAVLLPDQWEPMLDELGPVLSPDGRQLAYASQHSGVRGLSVVDLTTGEVRDIDLGPDPGALVTALQWSPDNRWIAWSGQEVKAITENGASYRQQPVAGTIATDATSSREVPTLIGRGGFELERINWAGLGICNDGTAIRLSDRTLWTTSDHGEIASWSRLTRVHGDCSAPQSFLPTGAARGGRLVGWLPGDPEDRGPHGVVLVTNWVGAVGGSFDGYDLRLYAPDGSFESVGHVEAQWSQNHSVATDLMTREDPTVPAGPSPWERPWLAEHWLSLLLLLGATAFVVLAGLRVYRVRRGLT